jgi:hypothetical protein
MLTFSYLLALSLFLQLFLSSVARIDKSFLLIFSASLVSLSLVFYLHGMIRIDGVDFNNYEDYIKYPSEVPDIGYRYISQLANILKINFTELLLIQAVITIYAVYKFSKFIGCSFAIAFTIFVLHSAVVRDFSQSRVGLSVAILLLGYAQASKFKKLSFFALATSIHFTALFPIIVFYIIDKIIFLNKRKIVIILALSVILTIFARGNLLNWFLVIDPRVDIYLNWQEDLYGNPATSFSLMAINVVFFLVSFFGYKATNNIFYKKFSLYSVFGIVFFYALSSASIFAFRLSHLLTIFYPFMLAKIYHDLNYARCFYPSTKLLLRLKKPALLAAFTVLIIGMRSSNEEVLKYIVPYFQF